MPVFENRTKTDCMSRSAVVLTNTSLDRTRPNRTVVATDSTLGLTTLTYRSTMSPTAANPQSHLELRIYTNCVGLYFRPPRNITSDDLAYSAMTTSPPNPTSFFICLLSGPLNDFLRYSRQEHSKWLIDIAHDICDPALKRGSLRMWDAAGEIWKDVIPTDPLTASNYYYDVQAVISLTRISERVNKSKTEASGYASTMANRVKQRDRRQCWVLTVTCDPSEWGTTFCALFTAPLYQLPLLPLYLSMTRDVASPSLRALTLSLAPMNLVCGLWPRYEVHLLSSTAKH